MTCEQGELSNMNDDELFEHMIHHGVAVERLFLEGKTEEALIHRIRVGEISEAMVNQDPEYLKEIARQMCDTELTGIGWDRFPTGQETILARERIMRLEDTFPIIAISVAIGTQERSENE